MTELVSVCICTYRRPYLAKTLESLAAIRIPDGLSVEIVIADNDAAGSAAAIVAAAQAQTPHPIRCEVEPRKGLAAARNRTLAMAQGDWLAFMDDDEIAEPAWLETLHATALETGAAAVVGLVEPDFESPPPAWALEGHFYDRARPATGTVLEDGRTGNALVRAAIVRDNDLHFDDAYSTTGGEDTAFFQAIRAAGGTIVSCRESVVWETVPADRVSMAYLRKRALRQGESYARIFLANRPPLSYAASLADSTAKLAAASLMTIATAPWGLGRYGTHLLAAIRNYGKLRYLLGVRPIDMY